MRCAANDTEINFAPPGLRPPPSRARGAFSALSESCEKHTNSPFRTRGGKGLPQKAWGEHYEGQN